MMRQTLMFLLVATFGVSLWTATPAPVTADEGCYEAEFTYTNTSGGEQKLYATPFDEGQQKFIGPSVQFAELNPDGEFDGTVQVDVESGSIDFIFVSTAQPSGREDVSTARASLIGQLTPRQCNIFTDGRLNSGDAAAPIVVYRDGDAFSFWSVNSTGSGSQILSVPLTDIRPAVDTAFETATNQLVAQQGGLSVYALSARTCQVNVFLPGGALYTFEWDCYVTPSGTVTATPVAPASAPPVTTTPIPLDDGVDTFTFGPAD